MIGSNLLDVIPCYVNAENISNCYKGRINISDVGSNQGILKILGGKIQHLTPKDYSMLPS